MKRSPPSLPAGSAPLWLGPTLDMLVVWDARTGDVRSTLWGHTGKIVDYAMSPDARHVMSISRDGLKIWDTHVTDQDAPKMLPPGHAGGITKCAVSADGHFLVTASEDASLKIWDPETGREGLTLTGHTSSVLTCAVGPDGAVIASGGHDNTIRLWDAVTGKELASTESKAFPMHPDLDIIDHAIIESISLDLSRQEGHMQEVVDCAISTDGTFLVSASADATLRVWHLPWLRERAVLRRAHADFFAACAISPNQSFIVSGDIRNRVIVWHFRNGRELELMGHTDRVTGCAVSPDSSFIVSVGWDASPRVWDPATGQERFVLEAHSARTADCAISPDGTHIVTASEDGSLIVWEARSGQVRHILRGHTGAVSHCTINPDGALIASAGPDNTLRVWDAHTGREVATLPVPSGVLCLAWHPHHPILAGGDEVGYLDLADLMGVPYGPIILMAIDRGDGPGTHCPRCGERISLSRGELGTDLACPRPTCGLPLRINPFVIAQPTPVVREPPPAVHPLARVDDAAPASDKTPSMVDQPPSRRRRWHFWRRR